MTMKEELAALKKKRDADKITAFQFKKQSDKIREKYGKKGEPSNVSKIFTYISTKSPMDALRDTGVLKASPKSVKSKAAANKAGLANRGKSQGGQKAGEAKKYATAKKVAANAKGAFSGLDLNKNKPRSDSKSSAKTWKDVKSVSAAKNAKLNYFTGRDGKKKIAITAEQLKKKGMSLREYANSLKGKK